MSKTREPHTGRKSNKKTQEFAFERKLYESIEIPEELPDIVNRAILRTEKKKKARIHKFTVRLVSSAAAVAIAVLVVGVNTSYAFAKTAKQIPVIEKVAKVTCVRTYDKEIAADPEPLQYDVIKLEKKIAKQQKTVEELTDETVSGQEETIVVETPATEQKEMTLDYWMESVTVEQLKDITEQYSAEYEAENANHPEKLETILLASDAATDVAVYGYHKDGSLEGVAIRIGNSVSTYDWTYMKEGGRLPDLYIMDQITVDGQAQTIQAALAIYNVTEQNEYYLESKNITESVAETSEPVTDSDEKNNLPDQNTKSTDAINSSDELVVSDGSDSASETTAGQEAASSQEEKKAEESSEDVSGNNQATDDRPVFALEQMPPKSQLLIIKAELQEQEQHIYHISTKELKEKDFAELTRNLVKADYYSEAKELKLFLTETGKMETINLSSLDGQYEQTLLSGQKWYVLGDKIYVYFELGIQTQDQEKIEKSVLPMIRADVNFQDQFTLSNLTFCK